MLAMDTGDDFLSPQDDDDDHALLEEEFMRMKAEEELGNATPPPEDDEEEPASFVMSSNNSGAVDDSFESYIFDSDGSEQDFQTRGRNHVIPVINSSPTKKRRPTSSPTDEQSDLAGTPPETNDLSGRQSPHEMYISPPSSSEYGASPTSEALPPAGALEDPLSGTTKTTSLPNFRYSSPPAIQTTFPPATHAAIPLAYHSNRLYSAPPVMNNGKSSPVVLETPPGCKSSPSTINMEESTRSSASRRNTHSRFSLLGGMNKIVSCILTMYLLFVTASFIYFVTQYVQVASLKNQVQDLTAQVDRLEAQVEELQSLLATLNSTVTELESQVTELSVQNDQLATQNAILEDQNAIFDNQTTILQDQIDEMQGFIGNLTLENEAIKEQAAELELENEKLTNLTQTLNATNMELEAQVENLTSVNDELVQSNEALTNQTNQLQSSLEELVVEFNVAYETVVELQDEVSLLQQENDRLANLTEALSTILSFLEETNQDANLTVDQLATQLETQITNNRVLVLENLENTLTQRVQSWNCDYTNEFAGSSFEQDYNEPIPSGSYDQVMDYVESRVLTDLCLDRADFELYLSVNFMPNGDGLTSNELISGVSMYTTDALNYYFPDAGETGVTPEEWAEALYDCSNLPPERQYQL